MSWQTLAKLPYFNFVEILQLFGNNTSGEMGTQAGMVNLKDAFFSVRCVSPKNEIMWLHV
jgi:hypothetical protein